MNTVTEKNYDKYGNLEFYSKFELGNRMKVKVKMLDHIIEISNSANFEVWESLLNPLFDIVEEYEEVLETKVKELKKEGKKISEIASLLKIPPIDVYEYIKKIKRNKRCILQ